jgi:hypothetical protein
MLRDRVVLNVYEQRYLARLGRKGYIPSDAMPATREKLIRRHLIKRIDSAARPGNDYGSSRIELTDAGRAAIMLIEAKK